MGTHHGLNHQLDMGGQAPGLQVPQQCLHRGDTSESDATLRLQLSLCSDMQAQGWPRRDVPCQRLQAAQEGHCCCQQVLLTFEESGCRVPCSEHY